MLTDTIKNLSKLRDLYGEPLGLAVDKQQEALDAFSEQFLKLSAFSVLSTASKAGLQDCSPRGDYPGFIRKLDDSTIAIPDRPGNNRLDSLSNIVENPNVGLLVLVPGFAECLRINGTAHLSVNSDTLSLFEYKGRLPKSVIVISISEIFFHCTKAIKRSNLWDPESRVSRDVMPSFARILMAQIDPNKSEKEVKGVEAFVEHRAKTMLY